MSNKKEKRSALEKELERRIKKFSNNPFHNTEPIQDYCEIIKEKAYENCDDYSYINFNEGKQYLPSGVNQLTGEAVVMINQMYADPFWIKSSAEDIPDAEIYIGKIDDPLTALSKTRAFWRRKVIETGEHCINELESIYVIALANYNDEANNTTIHYALITGFINNTMFEFDFFEAPSIKIIKGFIADISAALKANLEKRVIDMPKKEAFAELIAKLIMMDKSDLLPSVSENKGDSENGKNDSSHEHEKDGFPGRNTTDRKKYNRQLKMAAVKLVKENNQPISQVEKNLGIGRGNINQWIIQYEKYGENAFKGSGSISPYPDKRALIKELFKDEIAAVPDTTTAIDTDKYDALNLTPEKEKRLAACSYKLRKHDKDFKISVVKRIKENQLPVPQVSEELGIDVSLLNGWVRAYDELGENEFLDSGSNPNSNPNIDSPVQNDTAKTTASGADHVTDIAVGSNGKTVYDRQFKMAAVKYVNENKLSAFQVAKELNIPYVNLNKWMRLYKKYGDNAFQGSGVYYGDIGSN